MQGGCLVRIDGGDTFCNPILWDFWLQQVMAIIELVQEFISNKNVVLHS